MDKFTVYIFKGTYSPYLGVKEISLKSYLKDCFNYSGADIKAFFKHKYCSFDSVEYTTEEIRQKVSEGMAIFPISETKEIKEVLNYIDIGLNPVFMKARDFQKLKKVYGDI